MSGQISVFLERIDELEKSKFILSDKKIGGVLKSIVGNPELFKYVRDSLQGFDFAAEFKAAEQPGLTEYSNRFSLKMPVDKKKLIAFTFHLLSDFDSKRRDLHQFLQDYFYEDGSVYESYRKFIFSVIKPFKKAVESLFKTEEPDYKDESVADAEKYFDSDSIILDNLAVEDLINRIQDISTSLAADDAFNHAEKKDMLDITEGLGNAIITRETRLIKLLWIGFKNTMKGNKSLAASLTEIESRLRQYKIIG